MIITLIHNWNQGAPLESEIDGSSDFSYFRSKFSKMEKWRVKYSFDLITLYIQSQNSYNFFFYKIVFELFLYNFIDIKKTFESTKWLWKIKPRITFGDSKLELYWLKTFFFPIKVSFIFWKIKTKRLNLSSSFVFPWHFLWNNAFLPWKKSFCTAENLRKRVFPTTMLAT